MSGQGVKKWPAAVYNDDIASKMLIMSVKTGYDGRLNFLTKAFG